PRAFWIATFSRELDSGLGPPAFTAMEISLPMRVNSLLSLALRAKILCLRFSKMRPIGRSYVTVGKNRRFRRGPKHAGRRTRPDVVPDGPAAHWVQFPLVAHAVRYRGTAQE